MTLYYIVNRSIHRYLFYAYLSHSNSLHSARARPVYLTSHSPFTRLLQDAYLIYCSLIVFFLRDSAIALPHTSTTICRSRFFQSLFKLPLHLLISRNKLIIVDDGFLVISERVSRALLSPSLQRFDLVTLSVNTICADVSHTSFLGANLIPVSIGHETFAGSECHPLLSFTAQESPFPINVIIGSRFLDEERLCQLVDPHRRNIYINHPDPAKSISNATIHALGLEMLDSAGDLELLLYRFSRMSNVRLTFYLGLTSSAFFIYSMIQTFSLDWNVFVLIDSPLTDSYYSALVEDYMTCVLRLSASLP
jgi:hypothetical protein